MCWSIFTTVFEFFKNFIKNRYFNYSIHHFSVLLFDITHELLAAFKKIIWTAAHSLF